MTITTRLFSFFSGQLVGQDAFGNRYFTEKKAPKSGRAKRWVIYNGMAEPSKVPAQWHGWLHYTHNTPPTQKTVTPHAWEKPHLPNLTGTKGAYAPEGSLSASGEHAKTVAEYTPWSPQ